MWLFLKAAILLLDSVRLRRVDIKSKEKLKGFSLEVTVPERQRIPFRCKESAQSKIETNCLSFQVFVYPFAPDQVARKD